MHYVYVLLSKKNGKKYTGCTTKEPKVRLEEHNSGTDDWTRHNGPFNLIHTEEFQSKREALRRERYLKSGSGRRFLNKIVPR